MTWSRHHSAASPDRDRCHSTSGTPERVSSRSRPCPSTASDASPAASARIGSPDHVVPPARGQPAAVAHQQRLDVGARGEDGRVDVEVAGPLGRPRADERGGRPAAPVDALGLRQLHVVERERHPLGHDGQQLAGRAAALLAVVEAPHPPEVVLGGRRALRHRHQRQIGQQEADRAVDLGGAPLAPGGQHLGDRGGAAPQRAGLLDPPPGPVGHLPAGGPDAVHLALVERPRQAAPRLELGDEAIAQLVQVLHVGHRVGDGALGERSGEPVGEPVGLRELEAELALHQPGQAHAAVADEAGGHLGVEQAARAACRTPGRGSRGPGWRRA